MGHTCVKPKPVELTLEDKLILLVEECGEVIQAATKCLRFGWAREQPGYGVNHDVLAKEVGDLLGVIDALPLDPWTVERTRKTKIAKAESFKQAISTSDAQKG